MYVYLLFIYLPLSRLIDSGTIYSPHLELSALVGINYHVEY